MRCCWCANGLVLARSPVAPRALALEGSVERRAPPFLLTDVHVRFLVALPLLIVAELVVHQRMRFVVTQFRERH